jgi:hypothetical protein
MSTYFWRGERWNEKGRGFTYEPEARTRVPGGDEMSEMPIREDTADHLRIAFAR